MLKKLGVKNSVAEWGIWISGGSVAGNKRWQDIRGRLQNIVYNAVQ
jgi:hypothetical protein